MALARLCVQVLLATVVRSGEGLVFHIRQGGGRAVSALWQPTSDLPRSGNVAVLLRGQTFRYGRFTDSCNPEGRLCQYEATRSLMTNIVQPLQELGNAVDLFVTDQPCDMAHALHKVYRAGRLLRTLRTKEFCSTGQLFDLRETLSFFEQQAHRTLLAERYELIIVTRHDIVWKQPFLRYSPILNVSNFNFASPCEKSATITRGEPCVSDILHMMPGHLYAGFSQLIRHNTSCMATLGHGCLKPALGIAQPLGATVSFALWAEPREPKVRGPNEWYSICPVMVNETDLVQLHGGSSFVNPSCKGVSGRGRRQAESLE